MLHYLPRILSQQKRALNDAWFVAPISWGRGLTTLKPFAALRRAVPEHRQQGIYLTFDHKEKHLLAANLAAGSNRCSRASTAASTSGTARLSLRPPALFPSSPPNQPGSRHFHPRDQSPGMGHQHRRQAHDLSH